jgi:hypothetical protein
VTVFLVASCSVFDADLLSTESNAITDSELQIDSSLDASEERDAEAGKDIAIGESGSDAPDASTDADTNTGLDTGMLDAESDADINPEEDADTDPADIDPGTDAGTDAECVPIPNSDSQLDCCPDDPDKTEPGVCGCGVEDSDSDSDEVLDCLDECPDDPDKSEPGDCGCGTPDLDDDSDGTANCLDACPQDPGKTEPGICGCGFADEQTGCLGLRDALIHRYSFAGSGTTVTDLVGDADGTVINTELNDSGTLELAGTTSDQYVDLPNGLVSGLVDASFEVWFTWNGSTSNYDDWQRIFDFGSSDGNEGAQGVGTTYIFLSPRNGIVPKAIVFAYTINGSLAEIPVIASDPAQNGVVTHLVAVIDDNNDRLRLYVNGEPNPSQGVSFTGALSAINDVNNWLGRSQYSPDREFGGSLHEFRIYNAALSAEQIQVSYAAGPDPAFFD